MKYMTIKTAASISTEEIQQIIDDLSAKKSAEIEQAAAAEKEAEEKTAEEPAAKKPVEDKTADK
jgi:hypothetical protein